MRSAAPRAKGQPVEHLHNANMPDASLQATRAKVALRLAPDRLGLPLCRDRPNSISGKAALSIRMRAYFVAAGLRCCRGPAMFGNFLDPRRAATPAGVVLVAKLTAEAPTNSGWPPRLARLSGSIPFCLSILSYERILWRGMPLKTLPPPLQFLFPVNERCRHAGKNMVAEIGINFGRHRLMDNVKEPAEASLEFRRAWVKGIGSLDLFFPGRVSMVAFKWIDRRERITERLASATGAKASERKIPVSFAIACEANSKRCGNAIEASFTCSISPMISGMRVSRWASRYSCPASHVDWPRRPRPPRL